MAKDSYEKILEWCLSQGAKLHPNIERKKVDGIWGMFAKAPIPKNTVIAMFPKDKVFQIGEESNSLKGLSFDDRYTHAVAKSICTEETLWGGFYDLYPLEDLKETSACFYGQSELETLARLNKTLHDYVVEIQKDMESSVEAVTKADNTLDNDAGRDVVRQIFLNKRTRAWDDGFVPLIDMFNHSDKYGSRRMSNKEYHFLVTAFDYKEGEQVWISYGPKDMYLHAIDYGYFDPAGSHCVDLGRVTLTAANPLQKKLFQYLNKKHKFIAQQDGAGNIHYRLEMGNALFLDAAPNVQAIELLRDLSLATENELKSRVYHPARFRDRMLQYIEVLLGINKVEDFGVDDLPPHMQYFYHMLKKERKMLLDNRDWVLANSPPDASDFIRSQQA